MKELSIFDKIRVWALEKGILGGSDSYAQYGKLMEENGELGEALMRRNNNNDNFNSISIDIMYSSSGNNAYRGLNTINL